MSDALQPQLVSVPARWVAYWRATCARDKIGETLTSRDKPDVYALARKHDAKPGPPYARYIDWREADCDLQFGTVVSKPIPPEGGVNVDVYAACKAVVVEFMGPYGRLSEPHDACQAYLKEHGLRDGGPCWEVYDGPPGPDGVAKTIVYYPVEV